MTKEQALKTQFTNALKAFTEVVSQKPDLSESEKKIYRDSAIQRFEFTTDLAWKLMKEILEEKFGIKSAAPKPIIREAFTHGLIDDDVYWLSIIEMRNMTSHTYDEKEIERLALNLPEVLLRFEKLLKVVA